MLRLVRDDDHLETDGPYPFPVDEARHVVSPSNGNPTEQTLGGLGRSADDMLAAVEDMSRRIDDLAREFNCPSHFDDDGDGDDDPPRAA